MKYNTRLAFRIALIAFIVFTVGMSTSTIMELFCVDGKIVYYTFGVGLGLSLFMIALSFVILTKPYKTWHLTFQLFLTLAFLNLADEITNSADNFKANELFIFVGLVYYFFILIKSSKNEHPK